MAAASVTLLRRVEVSDKDPFCPEIPHFIFKPGNWLLISILYTSCPGAGWWQQTAKFRSCLRSVNWVIHGLKNGIKHLKKKKTWLTDALDDIQWKQVWLFHRLGVDGARKTKDRKQQTMLLNGTVLCDIPAWLPNRTVSPLPAPGWNGPTDIPHLHLQKGLKMQKVSLQ